MDDPVQTRPYGSWPSPLDARQALSATTRRRSPRADGDDLYWLEARPEDAGRVTLVRRSGGGVEDVSPAGHNVRTRYLEYGGGDYAVSDGTVLWVDFATQQVWVRTPGHDPRALTPETGGSVRWSCFRIDHARRAVFSLREDQCDRALEPVNSLVRLDLDGDNDDLGVVLVAGKERRRTERGRDEGTPGPDFVLDPVVSPDGSRIAWLTWDHPHMSWHETTLWLGDLDERGDLRAAHPVAGGSGESLEQPQWLDDATLLVLSDRTGWSNLHRLDVGRAGSGLQAVTSDELELGLPRWVPDMRSYALLPDGRIASGRSREGFRELVVVDPATGAVEVLVAVPDPVLTAVGELTVLADGTVAADVARRDRPPTVVTFQDGGQLDPVVPEEPDDLDAYAAVPEPVTWPTPDGATAHGFLYRPRSPAVRAPAGDLPPLLVTLHGGPTAATVPGLRTARTYWTSRGFAVLDVNYGGSTGYGRAYRERLDGRWGEVDVHDAASGARRLAELGLVDGARLLITGGSAGGFTTLAAATFTDVFAAGASHFGISDLATLATDTHKLESRYCDGLVAPWPEGREVYAARSPIHHVDRLATPLILLQGTDDQVVPRAQAERMAEVLRAKGLPVALVLFEGEGHGFRALDNQVRALEAELSFYVQVLGQDHPEGVVPVPVENLPSMPPGDPRS